MTTDPTPALLSAARLSAIRDVAADVSRAIATDGTLDDATIEAVDPCLQDLLAHLDALQAPVADGGDMARAIEYAQRVTSNGVADDGTILSRSLLASRAEIARLTAELAEASNLASRVVTDALAEQAATRAEEVAAARREGARDEREACVGDMRAAIRDAREKPVIDRAEQAIRARGEDRPPCPGEGWEWDAFALQWFQPGAKGKAIATIRARGEGQGS